MAKVLYTQKGSDPTTITWPIAGCQADKITLTSGTPQVFPHLIGHGDGSLSYSDGRDFPAITSAGSTFNHSK